MVPLLLSRDLLNQGFSETILKSQRFRFLCVSKYSLDGKQSARHLPIGFVCNNKDEAEIEVRHLLYERDDISIVQTAVLFKKESYLLESLQKGLGRAGLVVGIYNNDDEYGIWRFYTDVPIPPGKYSQKVVTSEELERRAKEEWEKGWW